MMKVSSSSVKHPPPSKMGMASASLPAPFLAVAFVLFIVACFSADFLVAAAGAVILPIGMMLLMRQGEVPILAFIFVYQWFQIVVPVYRASILGQSVDDAAAFWGTEVSKTALIAICGLFFVALGMRAGAGPRDANVAKLAYSQARHGDPRRFLVLYLIAFGGAAVAVILAKLIPGLSQPLLAAAELKWAFFFALTYATFVADAPRSYWLAAFGFELIFSFGGYFADFKSVFFVSLLGVVAAQARFSARAYIGLGTLAALLLGLAVVWTGVKGEYRQFVSGGQTAQQVVVPFDQRISKLIELVANMNAATLSDGVDALTSRIGYLDFFAATLQQVPAVVPHENGALWLDAIVRPFTPRILFPNKAPINDSERTRQFSGIGVASVEEGTSISMGYMAEAYVDFGLPWMMLVLLAFGYLLGWQYRYLASTGRLRGLWGMGLTISVLHGAAIFESSITKTFGGLISAFLVAWLLIRFLPNKMIKYLNP